MADRPNFLHFLEGIGSGILIVTMLCGFVGQYFIFRTHAQDFETTSSKKIEVLIKKHDEMQKRMNRVAVAESALSTDIGNIKRQMDRMDDKLDRVLEQLRR